MSTPASRVRAQNLRTLAALAALFLLPLAVAFFAYYGTGWRPAHRVNHGELITPPRPLPVLALARLHGPAAAMPAAATPAATLRGTWSLVYLEAGDCAAECRDALYLMRQTRLALNNDMTRVARVLLLAGDCPACRQLAEEDPGLALLDATGAAAAPLLREFPAARAHTVFVVDPLGNLVMSYDARRDPHGLLEDLKKLLRLSHIG